MLLSTPALFAGFGGFLIVLGTAVLIANLGSDPISAIILFTLLALFGLFIFLVDVRMLQKVLADAKGTSDTGQTGDGK